MNLEDGRFLCHPARYDILLATGKDLSKSHLVRVSERFRVIALGLPVPRYLGYPLDPPLRSRFQSRDIRIPQIESQAKQFLLNCPRAPVDFVERLISLIAVLRTDDESGATNVPEFPEDALDVIAFILNRFPAVASRFLVDVVYPVPLLISADPEQRHLVLSVYKRFGFDGHSFDETGWCSAEASQKQAASSSAASVKPARPEKLLGPVRGSPGNNQVVVALSAEPAKPQRQPPPRMSRSNYLLSNFARDHAQLGPHPQPAPSAGANPADSHGSPRIAFPEAPFEPSAPPFFVETGFHASLSASVAILLSLALPVCVVGARGTGKSALVRSIVRRFGWDAESIPLHRDLSARDLLSRRATTSSGDTTWEDSPLVRAAVLGKVAILDGLETLPPLTIATLARLLRDREAVLPSGEVLIPETRWKLLASASPAAERELIERGVRAVREGFKVIAMARTPGRITSKPSSTSSSQGQSDWITPEIMNIFTFVTMGDLTAKVSFFFLLFFCND
jgi:MoxR-like ATPase